jgi:hypothetical protein
MPDKRYQVFVSSTSKDLEEERRAVIDALLEASYMPVGMELFNASLDQAWPTIQRIIDGCDYYIVVVAAKYGSERKDGVSFTESEYNYAKSLGKPILAFPYGGDPELLPKIKTEASQRKRAKLERFRARLEEDLLCKYWDDKKDLARVVIQALNQASQEYPQAGWVRSDSPDILPNELRTELVTPSEKLGIRRISLNGKAGDAMDDSMSRARAIAIMSTSALRVIELQKPNIVEALASGCQVRVLVPELDGLFVKDVDESESEDDIRDPISDEIRKVERVLREALGEASRSPELSDGVSLIGSIQIGYFTSHLRSTMVLCDDSWGWLTITLPPARAP